MSNGFFVGLEYLMLHTDTSHFRTYWQCQHYLKDKKLPSSTRQKDADIWLISIQTVEGSSDIVS